LGFKEYKKVFDLSSFQLTKTEDSLFKDNYQMLSVRQLGKAIDSLEKNSGNYQKKTLTEMAAYFPYVRYIDTGWKNITPPKKPVKLMKDIIPDSAKSTKNIAFERVLSQVNSIKSILDVSAVEAESKRADLRMHLSEWHKKFTMSIACLVLFLIGAPLGSIIRKGGLGTPLVFAVVFFVVFFLLNNFGLKLVKTDVLKPVTGMWLATFILTPIGFFLIYKAMHDSQLFNQEFYFRNFRKFSAMLKKPKADSNKNEALPTD
jgi:lipopolysaccharide export system permease protein